MYEYLSTTIKRNRSFLRSNTARFVTIVFYLNKDYHILWPSNSDIICIHYITYWTLIFFQLFDAVNATSKMATGYEGVCSLVFETYRTIAQDRVILCRGFIILKVPIYSVKRHVFWTSVIFVEIGIIILWYIIYWFFICNGEEKVIIIITIDMYQAKLQYIKNKYLKMNARC